MFCILTLSSRFFKVPVACRHVCITIITMFTDKYGIPLWRIYRLYSIRQQTCYNKKLFTYDRPIGVRLVYFHVWYDSSSQDVLKKSHCLSLIKLKPEIGHLSLKECKPLPRQHLVSLRKHTMPDVVLVHRHTSRLKVQQ